MEAETHLTSGGAQPQDINRMSLTGICLYDTYVNSGLISIERLRGSFPTCTPNGYPRMEKFAYNSFAPPKNQFRPVFSHLIYMFHNEFISAYFQPHEILV